MRLDRRSRPPQPHIRHPAGVSEVLALADRLGTSAAVPDLRRVERPFCLCPLIHFFP